MKLPKFMKHETTTSTTPKKYDNNNMKLKHAFKNIEYYTPQLQSLAKQQQQQEQQPAFTFTPITVNEKPAFKFNAQASKTIDLSIYNITPNSKAASILLSPKKLKSAAILNVSSSATANALNSSRYTRSAQPKRLKRNHQLIKTKFTSKLLTHETPVKAYLNSKKHQNKLDENDNLTIGNASPAKYSITTINNTKSPAPSATSSTITSSIKCKQTRSPLATLNSNTQSSNGSSIKNFVKNSFSNLNKLMNKSKSKLTSTSSTQINATTKSPNASLDDSLLSEESTSMSSSSSSATSPEFVTRHDNIYQKIKQNNNKMFNNNHNINSNRRPVMGITALMLQNYKQTSTMSVSSTTWPNVYLLGIPIVFNNNNQKDSIENKNNIKRNRTPQNVAKIDKNNSSKSLQGRNLSKRNQSAETNNETNRVKLEIFGTVNDSIL